MPQDLVPVDTGLARGNHERGLRRIATGRPRAGREHGIAATGERSDFDRAPENRIALQRDRGTVEQELPVRCIAFAGDLKQAAAGNDPIVIIRPNRPFRGDQIEAVDKFLRRGGSLLLLDSPSNTNSTANELLKAFGLSFAPGMGRGSMAREPISGASIRTSSISG